MSYAATAAAAKEGHCRKWTIEALCLMVEVLCGQGKKLLLTAHKISMCMSLFCVESIIPTRVVFQKLVPVIIMRAS